MQSHSKRRKAPLLSMSEFARLLQLYRNRWRDATGVVHRLSQEEVSIRLGYGESTYGQWERGRGKPTHREDVVKLVQVFYEGHGLGTIEEANQLLQASGHGVLYPHEIREIAPKWLAEEDEQTRKSIAPETNPVVRHVYERFPTEMFCNYISQGSSIRILNTWIPNLSNFIDPLIQALQHEAAVQLLLLYPKSAIAELRNEALTTSPMPILKERVQIGIEENLDSLSYIAQHLLERQQQRLQVRLFHSLPSISIYQVDQFCLAGIYFHGQLAINSPQLEISTNSFFGQRIDKEFNTLWSIGQPIKQVDHWQQEIDRLATNFRRS